MGTVAVKRAARPIDIEHLDIVGHEAHIGIRVPVEPKGQQILLSPNNLLVTQIQMAVTESQFPSTGTSPAEWPLW